MLNAGMDMHKRFSVLTLMDFSGKDTYSIWSKCVSTST